MKNFLILLVVVALAVLGVGFYRGWFQIETHPDNTKTQVTVSTDPARFKQDKKAYQQKIEAQLQQLDEELMELRTKAKTASADLKAKFDQDLDTLRKQKEVAHERIRDVEQATAERWEGVATRVEAAMADLRKGFANAAARFK